MCGKSIGSPMTALQVKLLQGWDEIEPEAWNRVLAMSSTRTIFQTLAWQQAWWEVFGRGKLLLVALYDDQRLMALAPLFADEGMIFLVGSGGSDYLDFLGAVSRPDWLRPMLDLARSNTSPFLGFRFYHLPAGSATVETLQRLSSETDMDCVYEGALEAPQLRFHRWPADERLPADKKSLLRHERTLQRLGRLVIHHFSDEASISSQLDTFFLQHIDRWSVTNYPSLFLEDRQRHFYRSLCKYLSPLHWLRFTRVTLDEQPIAFHFGFYYDRVFLWYKPSFDLKMAKYSPGEVLLRALLLQSQFEGADVFDFGLGDEPFKSRFATDVPSVQTWGLYPKDHVDRGAVARGNECKSS